jgi:hypothetical protein
MQDSTPKAWSSTRELRLPLDQGMLEAAGRMYQDNRGALYPRDCLWGTNWS